MSKRKCRCACGRLYTPIDAKDDMCLHCRTWRKLLFEKDTLKFERGRAKYNETYGTNYSYGQLVLLLENIERKRKGELEKGSRMRFKKL